MSCAQAKIMHVHPNFDWTKANSFQVKTLVTEGKEVIPSNTANAYENTPEIDMT